MLIVGVPPKHFSLVGVLNRSHESLMLCFLLDQFILEAMPHLILEFLLELLDLLDFLEFLLNLLDFCFLLD